MFNAKVKSIIKAILCVFSMLRQIRGTWLYAGCLQLQAGDGGASNSL